MRLPPELAFRTKGQLAIDLIGPETGRLLAHPPRPDSATHWLAWHRRHQALSAWYHQRARLPRDTEIVLVS
jgi:hypothetical protein